MIFGRSVPSVQISWNRKIKIGATKDSSTHWKTFCVDGSTHDVLPLFCTFLSCKAGKLTKLMSQCGCATIWNVLSIQKLCGYCGDFFRKDLKMLSVFCWNLDKQFCKIGRAASELYDLRAGASQAVFSTEWFARWDGRAATACKKILEISTTKQAKLQTELLSRISEMLQFWIVLCRYASIHSSNINIYVLKTSKWTAVDRRETINVWGYQNCVAELPNKYETWISCSTLTGCSHVAYSYASSLWNEMKVDLCEKKFKATKQSTLELDSLSKHSSDDSWNWERHLSFCTFSETES